MTRASQPNDPFAGLRAYAVASVEDRSAMIRRSYAEQEERRVARYDATHGGPGAWARRMAAIRARDAERGPPVINPLGNGEGLCIGRWGIDFRRITT